MTPSADVVVIGGGLAGLAAAVRLAPHRRVLVLEAGDTLGGQCAGGERGGRAWDLGVHGLYPRYTELTRLLAECGAPLTELRPASRQHVITTDGVVSPIRMSSLPSPFNGLVHAALLRGASLVERMRLVDTMRAVLAEDPDAPELDTISLRELARRARIPERAFRIVFEPLAWLGFFLGPDELSARAFLGAMRFLLIGRRDSWCARWVPTPNSALLVDPLAATLARHGGRALTRSRATGLAVTEHRITGVRFADREGREQLVACDAVVCATPPLPAADLVATIPGLAGRTQAAALRALGTTSARTLRIELAPGPQLALHHGVVLTDRAGFALLDVGQVMPAFAGRRVLEVQCGPESMTDGVDRIVARVRALLPDAADAVVRDVSDTGDVPYARYAVGSAAARPDIHSPWHGMYFAGDWVHDASGAWFMERAVRTGRAAASAILGTHLAPAAHPPLDGATMRVTRAVLRRLSPGTLA